MRKSSRAASAKKKWTDHRLSWSRLTKDRGEKPHRLRLLSGWTRQFFMKFRGRNAHPNRVEKPSKWTWAGWRIPEIAERLAGI
jgi:hypothetical protein